MSETIMASLTSTTATNDDDNGDSVGPYTNNSHQHDTISKGTTAATAEPANGPTDGRTAMIAMSNGRRPAAGLRRQPTKYPHGLGISVQTITDHETLPDYSTASTLTSGGWTNNNNNNGNNHRHQPPSGTDVTCRSAEAPMGSYQRSFKVSMISSPENLAELHVRRYKYPLTGNYYLDPQEAAKSPLAHFWLEHTKRFCQWKYLRWPLIFAATVLLLFGFITYCIWLHDVSVQRQRWQSQQRRYNFNSEENGVVTGSIEEDPGVSTMAATTVRSHPMLESTRLRSLGSRPRQRPKEQKLTTIEYDYSKSPVQWDKERKDGGESAASDEDYHTNVDLVAEEVVRFTSGHQNSFGISIDEDDRLLKILKGLQQSHGSQEHSTATVLTKVSPTIPPVTSAKPTAPLTSPPRQPTQDYSCYSTSLQMCRGVMDYDLTYNSTTKLQPYEMDAYQTLINANCSLRAMEFVCSALEPECRPLHIGVLPPCRRICKAILEACSIVIANSDVLTGIFDCNLYPDSSDPRKCEDPSRRRGYCYDNEFECFDRSCIPQQWQCDNIKDCAAGEDEESCLLCDHAEEFRCRSNEKCVPESVRCDLKYDCFDGSDEEDCDEYGSGAEPAFDEADFNSFPRVFSYASFLSPNQSQENLYTYITAAIDDEEASSDKFVMHEVKNQSTGGVGVSKEEVTNAVPGEGPKGFVNFRDSKEIMMTSDSENKFKYSASRSNRSSSSPSRAKSPTSTTPLKPAASQRLAITTESPKAKSGPLRCAAHQLRCVSGKCITVSQICDKKIDCPDGADELMCVYKDRPATTARSYSTPAPSTISTTTPTPRAAPTSTTTTTTTAPSSRSTDKRTLRTTITRKSRL